MRWLKYLAAALTVAPIVIALRLASVSYAGVAAPLLLLDVVIVARLWGTGPALVAAASGAGAFSYYFLPPVGFGIEAPEDWIAFVTFIVTAVIAGELASRAERRAAEAQAGRREIERLYQELQGAFERASEAEAARRNEQLKAALLDALTHNLRTPLTSIKAAVTALIRTGGRHAHAELSVEGRRELLQVIDEESDRLNRFIEGLSTPDNSAPVQPIHLRAIEVAAVVHSGLHRAETVTRDHHVVVVLDEGLPAVCVDAASITEVIYILLDNASKYAPRGTTITVRALREDERGVRVAVCDEGPGVPEELRERVFEKFFRVPARESHDPNRGGIGLGLSIARRLVEAQGGRIWIDAPASGRGASVQLTLPTAAETEVTGRETGENRMMATTTDSSRVLVVDDEPQITRVLRTVLTSQGYQVRTAAEGEAALANFAEFRPELVITDLYMPHMDGVELCKRIRAVSAVPIIVLSVKGEERTKVEALDSGADDYVTKPFGIDELLARVRAALRRGGGDTEMASFEAGEFRVDLEGRRVHARGNEVRLTPKEFELFVYMARHPNRVITHRTLLEAVWGEASQEQPEYLRVFMGQLRKKLEPDPSNPRYLVTEPWVGYRFNPNG